MIELLVVIAIIAILAAILFPVFARAREKARQASCQSNLKQLALGVLMYAQDYDETLPATPSWGVSGSLYHWWDKVMPYVKNVQLYRCPSSRRSGLGVYATPPTGTVWWSVSIPTMGYGWNMFLTKYDGPGDSWREPMALGEIKRPVECLMMGDSSGTDYCWNPYKVAYAEKCGSECDPCVSSQVANPENTRHNGGSNLAFCDGHVKWLSAQEIVRQATAGDCHSYFNGLR